ncbi:MAG: trypsin-like peptidase domain-containing protein [Bacteroidales bacterium]|nr:trypsin-like peptidase domain-containing protein [Bacteroidales bacterium]
MRKYFLLSLLIHIIPCLMHAQQIWEDIIPANLRWSVNPKLEVKSDSLSKLEVCNYNKNIGEGDNWDYETISIDLSAVTDSTRVKFSIMNLHNKVNENVYYVYNEKGKKIKHENWKGIYWGYHLNFVGDSIYKRYHRDYYNRANYHVAYRNSYSGVNGSWEKDKSIDTIRVNISIIEDTLRVFENRKLLYKSANSRPNKLEIIAGSASHVVVDSFTIEQVTIFGRVEPYIVEGDNNYDAGNFFDAALNYSKAIERGYEDYDIYYRRGMVYMQSQLFLSAIDDFTKALSYKESDEAYLYRGLAKMENSDLSGLADLKLGGLQGAILLKEYKLKFGIQDIQQESSKSEYRGSGTGFFIDSRGFIVTNDHVVKNASTIDVFFIFNGEIKKYATKLLVADKNNDLVILKIDDPQYKPLPEIPYMIDFKTQEVGTSVYAMGFPSPTILGEEIKVTDGIISSKTGERGDVTVYQISAPIQPGNSGGPLFNKFGYVVGITNAGMPNLDNVGYAIKSSYLNSLIESCPEKIKLPSANKLNNLSLPEKVKKTSPYVVLVRVR